MKPRQPYPTDLTDHEWTLIEPYVPQAKRGGRPEHYPKREILNGIFYIVRGGCAWHCQLNGSTYQMGWSSGTPSVF